MLDIKLMEPSMEYEAEILRFRAELLEANDPDDFAGCAWLEDYTDVKEWLAYLASLKNSADRVPSDLYLAVRKSDEKIVGMINLRHHIDHPILGLWGGHIGYTVCPTERGKGYAKEMLRQNLENCRVLGLDKVLITCDEDNIASECTILANGGVFERTVEVDGSIIKRYWIKL